MNDKEKLEASRLKIQNTMSVIDELLELTRSILQECDKDPDKNDLAIKSVSYTHLRAHET